MVRKDTSIFESLQVIIDITICIYVLPENWLFKIPFLLTSCEEYCMQRELGSE